MDINESIDILNKYKRKSDADPCYTYQCCSKCRSITPIKSESIIAGEVVESCIYCNTVSKLSELSSLIESEGYTDDKCKLVIECFELINERFKNNSKLSKYPTVTEVIVNPNTPLFGAMSMLDTYRYDLDELIINSNWFVNKKDLANLIVHSEHIRDSLTLNKRNCKVIVISKN